MLTLLWILQIFVLIYEWRKKSISVLFWASVLIMFTLPHTVNALSGNYYREVIFEATLFADNFILLYIIFRIIYFSFNSEKIINISNNNLNEVSNSLVTTLFWVYVISFLILLISFYSRGFSLLYTTWTEAISIKTSVVEKIAMMIVSSFSGLGYVLYFRKEKIKFVISLIIYFAYLVMTKSRYNLIGFIIPFMIYLLFHKDKKKVLVGIVVGVLAIFAVYVMQQIRWLGGFSNLFSVSLGVIIKRSINYMREGKGEFGLIKAFYYYIEKNNVFTGFEFSNFGSGDGFIRILLMPIPSSLADFKPRDFAIDMYREWFQVDNPAGTMHPTVFGDAYANFGYYGFLISVIYAIFMVFVDEIIYKSSNELLKILKISLAGTLVVVLARGAAYNSIFDFISGWIIIEFLYYVWKKIIGPISRKCRTNDHFFGKGK